MIMKKLIEGRSRKPFSVILQEMRAKLNRQKDDLIWNDNETVLPVITMKLVDMLVLLLIKISWGWLSSKFSPHF